MEQNKHIFLTQQLHSLCTAKRNDVKLEQKAKATRTSHLHGFYLSAPKQNKENKCFPLILLYEMMKNRPPTDS